MNQLMGRDWQELTNLIGGSAIEVGYRVSNLGSGAVVIGGNGSNGTNNNSGSTVP